METVYFFDMGKKDGDKKNFLTPEDMWDWYVNGISVGDPDQTVMFE